MDYPKFKYHPNAYDLDIFVQETGMCDVCGKQRDVKYDCSFYAIEEPTYICPFCIADGSAIQKYNGAFNDYLGIESVIIGDNGKEFFPKNPNPMFDEIAYRTPSYHSWQQQIWLSHCNEPCKFIGYADFNTIKPFLHEVIEDIGEEGFSTNFALQFLSKDGDAVGCLFQCIQCGKH